MRSSDLKLQRWSLRPNFSTIIKNRTCLVHRCLYLFCLVPLSVTSTLAEGHQISGKQYQLTSIFSKFSTESSSSSSAVGILGVRQTCCPVSMMKPRFLPSQHDEAQGPVQVVRGFPYVCPWLDSLWPGLVAQSIMGWTVLGNVFWGLGSSATRKLVSVGNLESIKVA